MDVVRQVVDAFNRQDWIAWESHWHRDAEWYDPPEVPGSGVHRGGKHSPVLRGAAEIAADGWNVEADAIESVGPGCVLIRARSVVVGRESGSANRGRPFPTGRPRRRPDWRVRNFRHSREAPRKPPGCGSRRCRGRTCKSRGGPGNSGARALTTRSLGNSHPTWSGTTRSASNSAGGHPSGARGSTRLSPQRIATRSMWLVSKSRTCATSPPPRSRSRAVSSRRQRSGAAVTTPFGAVTEIRDGLAVRQRFWTDQAKALEAAGLSE